MRTKRDVFGLKMVLLLGHNGGCDGQHSEPQLRRGWRMFRDELTDQAERPGGRPGTRPWAWWVFDRGFEDEPDRSTAVAYLAEHGLLTEWEREALAAASNRLPRPFLPSGAQGHDRVVRPARASGRSPQAKAMKNGLSGSTAS